MSSEDQIKVATNHRELVSIENRRLIQYTHIYCGDMDNGDSIQDSTFHKYDSLKSNIVTGFFWEEFKLLIQKSDLTKTAKVHFPCMYKMII